MIYYSDRHIITFLVSLTFCFALSFIIYSLFYTDKNDDYFENIYESMITIQFNDRNFYNEVNKQINTTKRSDDTSLTITIFKSDIKDITSFTFSGFSGSEIRDISGIKYFTALTSLTLQDSNYLTDISEIAYLTNLEELYLNNNKLLSDLSPISELTKVKKLDLEYSNSMTNISNVNAIANLTKLEYLNTSVYNMDYDIEIVQNEDTIFKLPALFSEAKNRGATIKLNSDNTIDVKHASTNEISVSAINDGTVTIYINGSVYDKITCNINFIIKDT